MEVTYKPKFLKDLAKIPTPIRKNIELFVFDHLIKMSQIAESGDIEKLKGYTGYYKVRFGNYRLGLFIKGDQLIVERVLHRKEIYKFFP